MTEEAKETAQETQAEQEPDVAKKLENFLGEEKEEEEDTFTEDEFDDEEEKEEEEEGELDEKDILIKNLQRKLKASESKSALEEAVAKYPHADREDLRELVLKRRPKNEIFRIAKQQEKGYLKGTQETKSQLKDILQGEREKDVKELIDTKGEIQNAWGKPLAGGTGAPAKPLTIQEFKRLPKGEQIRRANEIQRSDNTKI